MHILKKLQRYLSNNFYDPDMDIGETLYLKNRQEWREWLSANFDKKKEIWLVFFKKHTGKPRIPYNDAVEEAICFGWIDSLMKRVDDEIYVQKFSPRRTKSNWSIPNKERARKMIRNGQMAPSGMAHIDIEAWDKERVPEKAEEYKVPEILKNALKQNRRASETFRNLAPSYKRHYIGWIMSAKRDETKLKRLEEAIGYLELGQKLPIK
jgi:uncharacterized protein YdeI (YjbR/CyaY-like superfamily)